MELAIKSNSSRSVVQLLLEAGAKPITSELLHESAVILACKFSSALLPDLLKYITDHKLLNKVDSAGEYLTLKHVTKIPLNLSIDKESF